MHGIETPENTRRLCLDAPGRPARPHEPRRQPPPPSHNREKTSRTGHGRTIRKSPRPHQAGGRGRPPAGQRGSHRPFANPGRPTPPDPTQTPRPARRDDGETGEALSDGGAAPPACPLPGCKAPQRGHHRIPSASTPRTRHDSPARNPPPRGGPAHSFFFSAGRLRLWIIPASRNPSTRHATGCARRDR